MELSNENQDSHGVDCQYYHFGATGMKTFTTRRVAREVRAVQKYLHSKGFAPKVLSEVLEVDRRRYQTGAPCNKTKAYAFMTETILPAATLDYLFSPLRWVEPGTREQKRTTKIYYEQRDMMYGVKEYLRRELQDLLGIDNEDSMDLHDGNWGLGKNSKPMILDTGKDFIRYASKTVRKNIGLLEVDV